MRTSILNITVALIGTLLSTSAIGAADIRYTVKERVANAERSHTDGCLKTTSSVNFEEVVVVGNQNFVETPPSITFSLITRDVCVDEVVEYIFAAKALTEHEFSFDNDLRHAEVDITGLQGSIIVGTEYQVPALVDIHMVLEAPQSSSAEKSPTESSSGSGCSLVTTKGTEHKMVTEITTLNVFFDQAAIATGGVEISKIVRLNTKYIQASC